MDSEILTKISVIGGLSIAAITVITNVANTFINKRYEYKQVVFRTIVECAYKEYEHRSNLVKELAEKYHGKAEIYSFFEYLVLYARLVPKLLKRKMNDKDMEKACKERKLLVDSFYKHSRENELERAAK